MRVLPRAALALLLLLWIGLPAVSQESEWDVPIAEKVLDAKPGVALEIELPADGARVQPVRITVPDGTSKLFVHVQEATADVDLWLVREKAKTMDAVIENAAYESATGLMNERLQITEGLRKGVWYLYAACLSAAEDEEVSFKLLVTFNEAPALPELPRLPFKPLDQLKPLERAVMACVMLNTDEGGGTGTVVTSTGLILTNRHVLELEEGHASRVYVSFSRDARSQPVQSHVAVVVEQNEKLDLALLRITEDINGNVIEKPQFTWLPIANELPELGDRLRCLGYPAIGNSPSIGSITLTSGVVSGFSTRKGNLEWIKTDCLISAGNSGGMAINDRHELAGVPTESMHDPDTLEAMGYVRPVGSIPKPWQERITKELPK